MTKGCAADRKRRRALFKKQGGRCYWCGENMVWVERPAPPASTMDRLCTLDHLFPKRNGQRKAANPGEKRLVAACYACNHDRGNRPAHKMTPHWVREQSKWPECGGSP